LCLLRGERVKTMLTHLHGEARRQVLIQIQFWWMRQQYGHDVLTSMHNY
jgi:hypothetical protein